MRKVFAKLLEDEMSQNKDIFLITADLGYGLWDSIRENYKDRAINVGSAEQLALGVCVGLAMEGKIPVFYSITPFAICRPFELIRNYVDHEQIPVKIIGGGRNKDYGYLGFSHWGTDDKSILSGFTNLNVRHPETEEELKQITPDLLYNKKPEYLNLSK